MAKILLIDDDGALREYVSFWLSRQGYEVVTANDGRVGVQLAKELSFDLIITDLIMPGKDGIETILAMRRDKMDVPILAISGGSAEGPDLYLRSAIALGANDGLAKPFTESRLVEKVAGLLRRTAGVAHPQ